MPCPYSLTQKQALLNPILWEPPLAGLSWLRRRTRLRIRPASAASSTFGRCPGSSCATVRASAAVSGGLERPRANRRAPRLGRPGQVSNHTFLAMKRLFSPEDPSKSSQKSCVACISGRSRSKKVVARNPLGTRNRLHDPTAPPIDALRLLETKLGLRNSLPLKS